VELVYSCNTRINNSHPTLSYPPPSGESQREQGNWHIVKRSLERHGRAGSTSPSSHHLSFVIHSSIQRYSASPLIFLPIPSTLSIQPASERGREAEASSYFSFLLTAPQEAVS